MKWTRQDSLSVVTTLFDFRFTEFLTLKIVRLLYLLVVVGAGSGWVFFGVVGFVRSPARGVWTLLLATVLCLASLAATRLWLEAVVVFFRLADSTAEVAEQAAQIALNTGRQTGLPASMSSS